MVPIGNARESPETHRTDGDLDGDTDDRRHPYSLKYRKQRGLVAEDGKALTRLGVPE